MKRILSLSIILILAGCKSMGVKYSYEYSMTTPDQESSTDFTYSSEGIKVSFIPFTSQMVLHIENNSKSAIRIHWDECAMVFNNESIELLHGGIGHRSKAGPMLFPNTKLNEVIQPAYFANNTLDNYDQVQEWEKQVFFPVYDHYDANLRDFIQSLRGADFTIYLTIERNGIKELLPFQFKVENIHADHSPDVGVYYRVPEQTEAIQRDTLQFNSPLRQR